MSIILIARFLRVFRVGALNSLYAHEYVYKHTYVCVCVHVYVGTGDESDERVC